jgi:protein-histidine N-methyltransferase
MAADERISTLVKWATSHGASLHPSVEVYDDPTTGFSFRVKDGSPTLEPWDRIVSLPRTLTLSYLNAVQDESAPFQGAFIAQTPPHVIGRFFLMWQYLLGEASPWWAYIQALAQPDDEESWQLAPFWPAEDAELLEGTNVEVGLEKIRRDVTSEYSQAAELFVAGLAGDDGRAGRITMGLYQWAYCVFSSRSFRPSLVIPETELPAGVKMDDFSVLLPLFDIGNHDMTLDVKWDVVLHPTNEAGITTNGTNSPSPPSSTCELRVGRPFQPGQQVFNNYSMKTNAELLLGYGFMLAPTASLHNDYIHVRKRAARAAAPPTGPADSCRPVIRASGSAPRTTGEAGRGKRDPLPHFLHHPPRSPPVAIPG